MKGPTHSWCAPQAAAAATLPVEPDAEVEGEAAAPGSSGREQAKAPAFEWGVQSSNPLFDQEEEGCVARRRAA